jgi:hypothetical protein
MALKKTVKSSAHMRKTKTKSGGIKWSFVKQHGKRR